MRRGLGYGAGGLAGIALGVVLTLAIQARSLPSAPREPTGPSLLLTRPAPPETFLAWVPRGLPDGFAARVARQPEIGRLTVVAEDNVWLVRSWSAAGELVDRPVHPYRIPLDVAAVDPVTFAPFLPPADQATLAAIEDGEGILGSTSASVRRLGPGALLELGGGRRIRIATVLPDELVGASELLVSKETGRRIGVTRDRYLLVRPVAGGSMTSVSLRRAIQPLLPRDLGVFRRVQARAPGETPYFRAGDAVLPPVLLKALFGEFAARPAPGQPGSLEVDPAWMGTHLVTTRIPDPRTGDLPHRDRPPAPGRDARAPGRQPRPPHQVLPRLLRPAVHQPRSDGPALPPFLGDRVRREPARQLLRSATSPGPAARLHVRPMGVPVGWDVRGARRQPLRVPAAAEEG